MKHQLKHRLTLVQEVEIPAGMDTEKLGEFLHEQRRKMFQGVTDQLLGNTNLTHKLRKATPSAGFELLL